MDARQAELLRSIDPAVLGGRLRAARVARGLTQTELAGAEVSVGYVSRLESGQRRPNGGVLVGLAARLGVSVEELLLGASAREVDEVGLALDYAELSLESGEPVEAEARCAEAWARAESASLGELAERGRFLHARALEALGRVDEAVGELEALVRETGSDLVRVRAGVALSRGYRESGDLTKAIEAGEAVLDRLVGGPLEETDESVQLAVTVAAAYFERGDAAHAVRVCRAAVARAEALGSVTARAAAYWNASVLEAHRGAVGDAVVLARRALALLGEGGDVRNLARLRTQLAWMQLRLDPPEVAEAERHLDRAAEDLAWSSASPVDVARNDLARARARFLGGEWEAAAQLSERVQAAVGERAPLVRGEALSLSGQVLMAQGDVAGAAWCFQQAVVALTGAGADRAAAQQWFELADLLDSVGRTEAARDAYRSAAASAGVRARPGVRVGVRRHEVARRTP